MKPLDIAEQPLPCPFCGGTNISGAEGSTFRWWFMGCQECGAQAGEVRIDTMRKREDAIKQANEDAIKEWNTRTARHIRESAQREQQAQRWIPIESAPKDDSTILLLVPTLWGKWNKTLPLSGKWEYGFWVIYNADEAIQQVEPTHWMPLPQPPRKPEGGSSDD